MYVAVNLRDDSSLNHVINLLLKAGCGQVIVGQRLEDMCATCGSVESRLPNMPTRSRVSRNRGPSNPRVTVHSATSNGNSMRGGSVGRTAQQFFQKTKQEVITDDHDEPAPGASSSSHLIEEDEELIDVGGDTDADLSTVSTALRLLSSSGGEEVYEEVVVHDQQQIPIKEDHSVSPNSSSNPLNQSTSSVHSHQHNLRQPSTRKRRMTAIMAEDLMDSYQCQICKKKIARSGQPANLVNHLNRHARIHASKKQFCCGACGAYFTRRYLTSNHINERHPNSPNTPIIDYGNDMRAEYEALLETCFPGADGAIRGLQMTREREGGETPDGERGSHHEGAHDEDLQEEDEEDEDIQYQRR